MPSKTKEDTMQSYLNDPKLKRDFVKEVKWHQDQDKIIKGTYQEGSNGDFKGCAVGCSIHSLNRMKGKSYDTSKHKVYETELGIPEWLARLEDAIFEGLPNKLAMKWPLRFAKAIPVGVNLEPVKWKISIFILSESIERVLGLDISDDLKKQVVDAIRDVLVVHEQAIKTGVWARSAARSAAESAAESAAWSAAWSARSAAWSAAESARSAAWSARSATWSAESATESAWSAARSAARSAAESAAWSAACSAAWSAWSAAESAAESARSAAESAARSAARSAAYTRYADKLIETLKASK
jgi:hypothetical protein